MNIFLVDGAPHLESSNKVLTDSKDPQHSGIAFIQNFANVSLSNERLMRGEPSEVLQGNVQDMARILLDDSTQNNANIVFDGSPISYLTYYQHFGLEVDREVGKELEELIDGIRASTKVILLRPVRGIYRPSKKIKVIYPHELFSYDERLASNYEHFFGRNRIEVILVSE